MNTHRLSLIAIAGLVSVALGACAGQSPSTQPTPTIASTPRSTTATPEPTPVPCSSTPTAGTPTTVPTATLDVTPSTLNCTDLGVPLSGGRYAFEIGPAPETHFSVELALGAGWVPQQLAVSQVAFAGPLVVVVQQHLGNTNGASLGFYSIQRVYRDPCHPEAGYAGSYLGTSNSLDLVNELGAPAGFDASPRSTLQIGDLTATHFVISNTIDTETAGCTDGQLLPLFITRDADRGAELETRTNDSPATNGGTFQEVWIVDRAGWALAIIGEVGGTSPEEDRAALEEIIGSITLGD